MSTPATHRVLIALFSLSRGTLPIDAGELGRLSGLSPTGAARALLQLEAEGLADASRARLTLLGLAHAARLAAADGGGGIPHAPLRAPLLRTPAPALAASNAQRLAS